MNNRKENKMNITEYPEYEEANKVADYAIFGLRFMVLVSFVFAVLKLGGTISFSWFWVAFPAILAVSIAVVLGVIGVTLIILGSYLQNKHSQ